MVLGIGMGGGEAERIVPWGVLRLEGLMRACFARWWATSASRSHKTQVATDEKRSQGKNQEARERKQGRTKRVMEGGGGGEGGL